MQPHNNLILDQHKLIGLTMIHKINIFNIQIIKFYTKHFIVTNIYFLNDQPLETIWKHLKCYI
jgi:hypothetical protein